METIYKSFDGKYFNTKGDCFVWEAGTDLRELKRQGKFDAFDWRRNPTDDYDDANYFVVRTQTAATALEYYFSELQDEGYYNVSSNPFEYLETAPGFYIWTGDHWIEGFETMYTITNDADFLKVSESDFEKTEKKS